MRVERFRFGSVVRVIGRAEMFVTCGRSDGGWCCVHRCDAWKYGFETWPEYLLEPA